MMPCPESLMKGAMALSIITLCFGIVINIPFLVATKYYHEGLWHQCHEEVKNGASSNFYCIKREADVKVQMCRAFVLIGLLSCVVTIVLLIGHCAKCCDVINRKKCFFATLTFALLTFLCLAIGLGIIVSMYGFMGEYNAYVDSLKKQCGEGKHCDVRVETSFTSRPRRRIVNTRNLRDMRLGFHAAFGMLVIAFGLSLTVATLVIIGFACCRDNKPSTPT